ncbi:hypothetical protein C8Q73DRAFT_640768 [Cubamyces lactineus]|nr:hypothetical protein C8Q73DRAFT_640768 [Cubamyces lactineus]
MRGERMIDQLRHEAEMYMGPLRGLQGQVVPVFYGFFTGTIEGVHIGCIVMEWCPGNEWVTFGKPNQKELADRWEAVRLLHRAGVKHGQLYKRRDSLRLWEGRHFLRAQDGKLRIVDFQQARVHTCAGSMKPHEDLDVHLDHKCRELCFAEIHWRRAVEGGPDFKTPWLPY